MIICLGTTPVLARTMRFGSLVIDGVNRTTDVTDYPAGKAVNVARVIKSLGGRPMCVGVSGGERGRQLRRLLDEAFLAYDFVDTNAHTRCCVTVIDDATQSATELIEDQPELTSQAGLDVLTRLGKLLASDPTPDLLVLAGSLARGMGDDFLARCVDVAHDQGVQTIVDATGEPLLQAAAVAPAVIKINLAEFCQTFGVTHDDDSSTADAINKVADLFEGVMIVTRGVAPTFVCDGSSTLYVRPPRVATVSPIGSGDSFCAGLAHALVQNESIEQAVVIGTACASANATSPHAGFVKLEDVRRLIPLVETWSG